MASPRNSAGFTMLEVLVSIFIMTIGLLGLAGMQVRAQQAELESYQRAQALILANGMVDRINNNRKAALCYNFTDSASGEPFAGGGDSNTAPVCGPYGTTTTRAQADRDMSDWHDALNGVSEQTGGAKVGAMVGARGCVSLDSTVTPNVYRVTVAWQGLSPTRTPVDVDGTSLTCGTGEYGTDDTIRRAITVTFPVACLSCS